MPIVNPITDSERYKRVNFCI
uniref:Uncharacterized protein n=1 Tax=Arundo donax TaxID=35708 RepID=A0A0A8Z7N1_ARUDO